MQRGGMIALTEDCNGEEMAVIKCGSLVENKGPGEMESSERW